MASARGGKPKDTGYLERLWWQTRPAPGTLVDLYLRARCIKWAIPPAIRFHPLLPYRDDGVTIGAWPAMVTRLDDADGKLVGLQRLWLDPELNPNAAGKAPIPNGLPARKTLGKQGVAWLGRRDVDAIIVGEGIESALSASEYGDETWPSWGVTPVAALSAGGLARFAIPPNIRRLFVAEDADDAGRQATRELSRRARAVGVAVTIMRVEPIEEAF